MRPTEFTVRDIGRSDGPAWWVIVSSRRLERRPPEPDPEPDPGPEPEPEPDPDPEP